MLKKLSSRKFLTALAGIVTGLTLIFGVDEQAVTQIAGAVTALASVVSYIFAEAKIDAANVKAGAEQK